MTWGTEKDKAMKLRIGGYSYNEIRDKLGIPKSTLRSWFFEMALSKEARARLDARITRGTAYLIRRNKMQTHLAQERAKKIRNEAQLHIPQLDSTSLLIIGTALYWAEGYKRLQKNGREITAHTISFVNSDAEMVSLFVCFLKEIMNIPVEHIRVVMRLYPHINERAALEFWKKATGLPDKSFYRSTQLPSISSQRKRPYNRLPYGTVQIAVNRTKEFNRLMGWIEGVKKQSECGIIKKLLG